MKRNYLFILLFIVAAIVFIVFNRPATNVNETAVLPPTEPPPITNPETPAELEAVPEPEAVPEQEDVVESEVKRCPNYLTNHEMAFVNHQIGWSATGDYVAYGQAEPDPKLFLLDLSAVEGSNLAPRIELSSIGWQFAWHPATDEIVYANDGQLIAHELETNSAEPLPAPEQLQRSWPQWLSDGSGWIFYQEGFGDRGNNGWYRVQRETMVQQTAVFSAIQLDDRASSRTVNILGGQHALVGERFAFTGQDAVFLLEQAITGGQVHRQVSAEERCAVAPAWSADGAHLAFLTASERGSANENWDLTIMTGDVQRQVAEELQVQHFAWSPNGTRLALIAHPGNDNVDGSLTNNLYLLDLEGDLELVAETEGVETAVSWSPDGSQLAVVVADWAGDHVAQWLVEQVDIATGERFTLARFAPR